MAKGNDGNYLQHGIEVEAAVHLAKQHPEGRLHISLTHGMAPFEGLEKCPPHWQRRRLDKALGFSRGSLKSGDPAVLTAYKKTEASLKRYPNSAELLKAVVGKDKLSGGITETCERKYRELCDVWSDSAVSIRNFSWRSQLEPAGVLACPENLQTPWLFTMDPMTYRDSGKDDDDKLYRADRERLSDALVRFMRSGQPGLAALFVYSVPKNTQCLFWKFVDDLAAGIGAATCSYWLPHRGGNFNLAALLSPSPRDFGHLELEAGRP